jgi:hypothetical protein
MQFSPIDRIYKLILAHYIELVAAIYCTISISVICRDFWKDGSAELKMSNLLFSRNDAKRLAQHDRARLASAHSFPVSGRENESPLFIPPFPFLCSLREAHHNIRNKVDVKSDVGCVCYT